MPPRKSKKSARRTRKKTVKKGGYYGFGGPLSTGAVDWKSGSEYGDFSMSRVGNNAVYGRGRKKTHRRKRHMKGGGKFGAVAASYTGTGERGMANYVQTNTHYPPFGGPEGGAFNNAGAQPGSGFASFIKTV